MKRIMLLLLALCFLLAGCSGTAGKAETQINAQESVAETPVAETAPVEENTAPATVIYPLPDNTMENLSDAILHVSLAEEDAYVDDTGKMQMDLVIYSYDKYDMVDIAMLKEGDILAGYAGEVEVVSIERKDSGSVAINGGLEAGGFDLVTEDNGIFYECGYNDAKNWYVAGEATIRVSADFEYHDSSDLDSEEIVYYPGSFLVGEVTDYNFNPRNTTVRVENGQIIEMYRVYVP